MGPSRCSHGGWQDSGGLPVLSTLSPHLTLIYSPTPTIILTSNRQHFNKLKRESNSKSVTSSPVKPITVSRKRKVIDVDTGNVDDEEDFGPVVIKCEPKKAKKEGKSEVFKDEAKPLEEDKS